MSQLIGRSALHSGHNSPGPLAVPSTPLLDHGCVLERQRLQALADSSVVPHGQRHVEVDVARPEAVEHEPVDEDIQERVEQLDAENERLRPQVDTEIDEQLQSYEDFLQLDIVREEIEAAKEASNVTPRYVKGILAGIIQENGPVSYDTVAERVGVSDTSNISKAASELERRKIVEKESRDDGIYVDLNVDGIQ